MENKVLLFNSFLELGLFSLILYYIIPIRRYINEKNNKAKIKELSNEHKAFLKKPVKEVFNSDQDFITFLNIAENHKDLEGLLEKLVKEESWYWAACTRDKIKELQEKGK